MIEFPHNLYLLFVNKMSVCDSFKRSSRNGVALTRSQQMVRRRRVVPSAKYRVRFRPKASGPRTRIRAGEVQVECDIEIHGGAAVTCCQYKQSAEPERQKHEVWSTTSGQV